MVSPALADGQEVARHQDRTQTYYDGVFAGPSAAS